MNKSEQLKVITEQKRSLESIQELYSLIVSNGNNTQLVTTAIQAFNANFCLIQYFTDLIQHVQDQAVTDLQNDAVTAFNFKNKKEVMH